RQPDGVDCRATARDADLSGEADPATGRGRAGGRPAAAGGGGQRPGYPRGAAGLLSHGDHEPALRRFRLRAAAAASGEAAGAADAVFWVRAGLKAISAPHVLTATVGWCSHG